MGLSRSAVNKLVAALENQLGVQLLHRSTRRVTPTATGLAFYDRALTILTDLEEAELAVSQLQAEPKGILRLNGPMTFGTMYLSAAILAFMGQYPDLTVQLTLEDRQVDPLAEGFDITVRIAQPSQMVELTQTASLITQAIAPISLVLCAAPDYLQAHGTPQTPTDLQHHSCLTYLADRGTWPLAFEGANQPATPTTISHAIAIQGRLCTNNGEVLREAALQGLGITLLPKFIVEEALRQGHLQPILADFALPQLTLCLIYPVNRHLSTKIRLLTAFLKTYFGDRQDWL